MARCAVTDYAERSASGRVFNSARIVRLADANEDGTLRWDGAARFLQDVATDDWDDTGITSSDVWVVRRTSIRVARHGRWPRYGERIDVSTWCSGVGAAWAERRTDIAVDGTVLLEAVAIWVPTDASGHPVRLRPSFFDVYADSVQGRRVSSRVRAPDVDEHATRRPWPLRRADLDVVGHVNNASVWQAISECVTSSTSEVSVAHHHSIEARDEVTLASTANNVWLEVGDTVAVSATLD